MTIEYMTEAGRLQVEHVETSELRHWAAEHPSAIILHAVPDPPQAD